VRGPVDREMTMHSSTLVIIMAGILRADVGATAKSYVGTFAYHDIFGTCIIYTKIFY
jgi:hypothetical protein